MKKKSVGFKIGVFFAVLHLCLAMYMFVIYVTSKSSTAGLAFVWFFTLDAPFLLLPRPVFDLFGTPTPLILYGIFGSAMWFLIPWLIDRVFRILFPKGKWPVRAMVILAAVPIILFGFSRLSHYALKGQIRQQRPEELKKALNRASSDFLIERVVFEGGELESVNSIHRMTCRPDADMELVVSLTSEVIFLNENFQEQNRLTFSGRRFNRIEPLEINHGLSCLFLAHRTSEGVYLLDSDGNERWSFTLISSVGIHPEDAQSGDLDGDGKTEFAVYYGYRDGIRLVDSDGNLKWKHPVYALGHLEITDLDEDGRDEIIYDNSNNARGITEFTILDTSGTVVNTIKLNTKSYEFAIIHWPDRNSKPRLLLTEENTIRITDFAGSTVMQFDAPGCRPFGKVKALTVRLRDDQPEYLAVRKSLHPDLMVLYVYDPEGKLLYQKTEVSEFGRIPTLEVIPLKQTGRERLLTGASRNRSALLLEYSANP